MALRRTKDRFVEVLRGTKDGFVEVLREMKLVYMKSPRDFKMILLLSFWESFAYFAFSGAEMYYLKDQLGFGDREAGNLRGSFGAMVTLFVVLFGSLVDFLLVRKTLLLHVFLSFVFKIAFALLPSRSAVKAIMLGPFAWTMAVGSPAVGVALCRYVPKEKRVIAFSIRYVIVNIAALAAQAVVAIGRLKLVPFVETVILWKNRGYSVFIFFDSLPHIISLFIIFFGIRDIQIKGNEEQSVSPLDDENEPPLEPLLVSSERYSDDGFVWIEEEDNSSSELSSASDDFDEWGTELTTFRDYTGSDTNNNNLDDDHDPSDRLLDSKDDLSLQIPVYTEYDEILELEEIHRSEIGFQRGELENGQSRDVVSDVPLLSTSVGNEDRWEIEPVNKKRPRGGRQQRRMTFRIRIRAFFTELWARLSDPYLWRLMLLSIIVMGPSSVGRYLSTIYPDFMRRAPFPVPDPEQVPYELFLMINPVIVIVFTTFIGSLITQKGWHPYWPIVVGMTLTSGGAFVMMIIQYWATITFLTTISLAEPIWSPILDAYVYYFAPKGKEGIFLSLAALPYFASNLLSGKLSGELLFRYCPAKGVEGCPHPSLIWLIIGVVSCTGPVLALVFYRLVKIDHRDDEKVVLALPRSSQDNDISEEATSRSTYQHVDDPSSGQSIPPSLYMIVVVT